MLSSIVKQFPQVEAKPISCLAEIYRDKEEFSTSLLKHSDAIEKLHQIGAKHDLAEAYYQIALTYQKMGELRRTEEHFAQAIALFQEMQAPRQVEKVQAAMGCF